jgi:hypothetical protein
VPGINVDAGKVLYTPFTLKIHYKCTDNCICDWLTPTEMSCLRIYHLEIFSTYVMFSVVPDLKF